MEMIQHFETKPDLCQKRSKTNDEDQLYLLSEAGLLARLAENARRLKIIQCFLSGRACRNYASCVVGRADSVQSPGFMAH
jgi:hypothetical protein